MEQLTVQEAAVQTGWTARMLRYVEQLGLVVPGRSRAGYRLYTPADLARLRSLRSLLETHDLELGDVAVVLRLRSDAEARTAVDRWLDTAPPAPSDAVEALRWEQDKHVRLLGVAGVAGVADSPEASHTSVKPTSVRETA